MALSFWVMLNAFCKKLKQELNMWGNKFKKYEINEKKLQKHIAAYQLIIKDFDKHSNIFFLNLCI